MPTPQQLTGNTDAQAALAVKKEQATANTALSTPTQSPPQSLAKVKEEPAAKGADKKEKTAEEKEKEEKEKEEKLKELEKIKAEMEAKKKAAEEKLKLQKK